MIHKANRKANTVEAYACACSCKCGCSCGGGKNQYATYNPNWASTRDNNTPVFNGDKYSSK